MTPAALGTTDLSSQACNARLWLLLLTGEMQGVNIKELGCLRLKSMRPGAPKYKAHVLQEQQTIQLR